MIPSLRTTVAVLAAASTLTLGAIPALAEGPEIAIPAGALRGSERDGVRVFKGIPYALPPVGQMRWKPPVAAPTWTGVRDATRFGAPCMQPPSRPGSIYSEDYAGMSEDCLSLNVWAPAGMPAKPRPVFVWIHGGSLTTGAGSLPLYDGVKLAKRDMVVVTINYRLGVFGYLAHPGLSAESPDKVSGNYGLLDQIAALEWVKRNIAAFGGDPDNVTIAGESAGALSVMYLMASPKARGLFHKAIAESAYMIPTPELTAKRHGNESAEGIGLLVAKAVGAADIAALRAMPAEQLRDAVGRGGAYVPFGTIDGKVLPRQLVDTFDRGEQAPVPIIAGYNSGEIRSLRFLLPPKTDPVAYEKKIRETQGEFADAYLKLYPAADPQESALASVRDAMYGWTSQRLAEKQIAVGAPGYLYLFDHGWPSADDNQLHAFHAAEIPFVFGTMERTPQLWPKTSRVIDLKLGNAIAGYWASFAHTGKPVAKGEVDWLQVGDAGAFMLLANKPRMALQPMRGAYPIHEQTMCRRRAVGDLAWGWNPGIVSPPLPPAIPACK